MTTKHTRRMVAAAILAWIGWGCCVDATASDARSLAVDPAQERLGRYVFRFDGRPADGLLPVPPGFPQIVQATVTVGGTPHDVPIAFNADATQVSLVLPAGADGGGITVLTSDTTRQYDDGRIVFTARDARVVGTSAKLETHPGNHRIGFWANPSDAVEWDWKPTRWGMYEATLTYSAAPPDGTEIEVSVGDVKLPARLASTGGWYRYATLPLGRVHVAEAVPQTVAVRCTNKVGGAVMNLKAVSLEPACEGVAPVQADDGSITLHSRDATVRGVSLRYEPAERKQTLGFWSRPTDAASWSFTVTRPGTFVVEVLQGCGAGQGGSTMRLEFDAGREGAPPPIEFLVEDTGGFQAFKPRQVGTVSLSNAGGHSITVGPVRIAKGAACDIRQIRLVPAAE